MKINMKGGEAPDVRSKKFVLMSGDGYKKYKTEEKILIKGGIT